MKRLKKNINTLAESSSIKSSYQAVYNKGRASTSL